MRFVKPKSARTIRRVQCNDGNSAGTRFRNSTAGRSAKREALGEQRRRQESLCANCNQFVSFEDAKFRDKVFVDGVENKVIHRKCPIK